MYGQPSRGGGGGRAPNFIRNPNQYYSYNQNVFPNSFQNPYLQYPNPNFPIQNPNFQFQAQPSRPMAAIDMIDNAVQKARREVLANGEAVSTWKVSQAALVILQADSWVSLGFQMQQVPSLNRLILTEGKINAFIHCFVGARRITTLHDLETTICNTEGVERFEELELGPLLKHPLITHYFSINSDVTEVCKITSEDIMSLLFEFMDTNKNRRVEIEELLDFIAKKQSVTAKEMLGVRIQSLGMHITLIRQARQLETTTVTKYLERLTRSSEKKRNRPLLSSQKKQMDEHFNAISERVKSFSSVNEIHSGKHIKFISSCSEDSASDDHKSEDEKDVNDAQNKSSKSSDRVSTCPYPSVAEEITRLGYIKSSKQSKRKRKYSNIQTPVISPQKVCKTERTPTPFNRKKQTKGSGEKRNLFEKYGSFGLIDSSSDSDSMKMFIITWKETCQANNVNEVFEKMIQFYRTRKKTTARKMFSSYPFIGLLHTAVTSIKNGMWDSMYDTFQNLSKLEVENTVIENRSDNISIDVESPRRIVSSPSQKLSVPEHGVSVEDIVGKMSAYLEVDYDRFNPTTLCTDKLNILRKLCKLESWLSEQFSAKRFESLGYGKFWSFMEKHKHLFVHALQKCLRDDIQESLPLKASMLGLQLDVLLSQALHRLLDNEKLNMQKVSELLSRQFPLVCFQLVQSDSLVEFDDIIKEKANMSPKCVIFSETLLKTDALSKSGRNTSEISGLEISMQSEAGLHTMLTSKDAMRVLLNAPMLTDLNLWSHWDAVFAPSLGSLVGWLLKEVNTKELLCLVTRGGKVIRVDHAASVDSFREALLQRSPFETASKLLSLLALNVVEQTLDLLKSYTQYAFGVFSEKNSPEKDSSRFILECLGYLPVEFCSFAAYILLFGFEKIAKDAPSALLDGCKNVKQRVMLHEIGFSLGIVEWMDDYHTFSASSSTTTNSNLLLNTDSNLLQVVSNKSPSSEVKKDVSVETLMHDGDHGEMSHISNISADCSGEGLINDLYDLHSAQLIESIRQEEFGLNPDISSVESEMLNKQHARLGRALHCLSHELYSQDSHFLLELVQNADDNIYPGNVEPTLTFILQRGGIVVLNNEQGFSARNIRALCDVGNSTKKGHNSGYIGKKGIGFKSVFRVTDAPEIHSNGFHIKFDITGGQIGFVLPTPIPPCDIDTYTRLVYTDTEPITSNGWRTCIVLPFRSSLLEGSAINNIASMFSDLHPSLLLFLHRLQCIKFRDMLSNSLTVMRKEVVGDGIVRVSCGKENMVWLVVSRKLQAGVIRPDVQTTEISMAFTLQEALDGNYTPNLAHQPVFAFLPLRKYGLKFILQGDFVLPSSREEVDGDCPWNQWLLSEFPNLFVNAEKSFCNLPCFRNNPAKGVTAYMSFVPLIGEVHGFFSSLPQMILSRLRISNCLILEGEENEWVPPCKVLRNWTEQARTLLPDSLLRQHLGLGYLHKDIVLSDLLARGLGIEEYGPKILIQILSSLCCMEDGLKSMGLPWLSAWLNSIYMMMSSPIPGQSSPDYGIGSDLIKNLRKIRFIPLSDGKFSSIDEGTIWLHADALSTGVGDKYGLDNFPRLYARLRIVDSSLFSADTSNDTLCFQASMVENISRMLYRVGIQQLSAHEIIKMHVLPSFSDGQHALADNKLMTDYLSFLMFHLQSSCSICHLEKDCIFGELRDKALILTNCGYKRCAEVPIHLSKEYENPIDMKPLVTGINMEWVEVHTVYLKHPITQLLPGGISKWRSFFMELGITDFVQIVQVEKSIADLSPIVLQNIAWDKDLISRGSNVKDWESKELVHLLSQLHVNHDKEKSKHLLGILDSLWDDCFSDKVNGFFFSSNGEKKVFESSFASSLCDAQWIISSMDDDLHHPKDLFYDCEAVHSILGASAPYTIPKVKSKKLVSALGLKTQVTVDDALSILSVWKRSESSFRASISQMSKFYTFIWNGISTSELRVVNDLCDRAFIFVPHVSGAGPEDAVSGVFLSCKEVYWNDSIGFTNQMKMVHTERGTDLSRRPVARMLCNVYPSLHDFFVNMCGVNEFPPFRGYFQILLQLSAVALPSVAAKTVFQVFLKWSEELKSGLLSSEDIECLKDNLLQKDFMVLPTDQDKWVSLNPSFGKICWCDDDKLKKEFKHYESIDFLYFGELTSEEKELLHSKVSTLMQKLGIPALSEVVTREAIYYGMSDPSFVASLVNWALPYAQRYIYNNHPKIFSQLKQSVLDNLRCLKIVVVEELFYSNVIKGFDMPSKKRFKCKALLKGNILYVSRELDSHAVFMELSRLFNNTTPDLHLANYLHMITTMAESGSTEEQTEFFILNSQKIPKLPEGEPVWSLSDSAFSMEKEIKFELGTGYNEPNPVKLMKKKPRISSNWPPADWKTAPGFHSSRSYKVKTQAAGSGVIQPLGEDEVAQIEINYEGVIDENSTASASAAVGPSQDAGIPSEDRSLSDIAITNFTPGTNMGFDSSSSQVVTTSEYDFYNSSETPDAQQAALLTGHIGERVAFNYYVGKVGEACVKWVNKDIESWLPYDLVVGDNEYIEVKATKNASKDWFYISMKEWEFAVEKGEDYSIAHVVLSANNTAKVTVYRNPAKLVHLGKLKLAITIQ